MAIQRILPDLKTLAILTKQVRTLAIKSTIPSDRKLMSLDTLVFLGILVDSEILAVLTKQTNTLASNLVLL